MFIVGNRRRNCGENDAYRRRWPLGEPTSNVAKQTHPWNNSLLRFYISAYATYIRHPNLLAKLPSGSGSLRSHHLVSNPLDEQPTMDHDPHDNPGPVDPKPYGVKKLSPAEEIPVFNCVALVSRRGGSSICRCANLADLTVEAPSEREALQTMVKMFKERVAALHSGGSEIPWIDPPQTAGEGESVRYLAVHL